MAQQEESSKTIKVTMPNRIYQKLKKLSDESGISMSKLMLLATLKEYKLIDDKNSEPLAQESNLVASLRRARSASHRQGKNPKEVEPLH